MTHDAFHYIIDTGINEKDKDMQEQTQVTAEEDDIEIAPLNKDMSASARRAASATARASRRAIKQVRESKILRAWAKARKARKSK